VSGRRWVAAVAVAGLVAGCSPAYVLRAAYGEAKILWRRVPIEDVLAQGDLDPASRRKLHLVLDARRFAAGVGLDVGGSFGGLSWVDAEDTVFVVTASKRTALAPYVWWFPIVGSLPYKGYFDRARAEAEAARLEDEGYDTLVRPAAAFSTLGWFDDPLLRHLLAADEVFLVDLVLHETYHRTFFLKGAQVSAFNESLATFVGHRGAIAFFAARAGDEDLTRRAEERWADQLVFAAFLRRLVDRLETLYGGDDDVDAVLAARARIFAAAREEARTLPFATARFTGFGTAPLNNAVVVHYRLYARELDLFERVWRHAGGLAPALAVIEDAARAAPEKPFDAVRRTVAAAPDAAAATGPSEVVEPLEVVLDVDEEIGQPDVVEPERARRRGLEDMRVGPRP